MATPFLIVGQAAPRSPIASVTASAASWRGTSMNQRAFATLRTQTFQGRGNGRFSLLEGGGPRVGASKGTIDAHFRMGTGADSVVLLQSSYSSTATPLITLGVNASGQAVGSIQDAAGTTVAAWAATDHNTVAPTGTIHLQLSWDATTPIDGSYHVWLTANGLAMAQACFTVAPVNAWVPFQGLYLTTGMFCGTGFDGEMLLTQASGLAPQLIRRVERPAEVASSTLTMPAPVLQLSGALTVAVAFTGAITLPSLQLSGAVTTAVALTGTMSLPSLQLSGALTPAVSLAASSITLPSNTLSGSLTVATNKIASWLRLAASTPNAGEYDSVVDILNANPTNQAGSVRKPAAGTSSNGLPISLWDGTDVLVWPLTAANNQTTKFGFACWVKFGSVSSPTDQILFAVFNGANGASVRKIQTGCSATGIMRTSVWSDGSSSVGRNISSAASTIQLGIWVFYRLEYDSSVGGDGCVRHYLNEVLVAQSGNSDIGAGGTLGVLQAPTGNAFIGAQQDADAPARALSSETVTGPNIYILRDNLTATEGANLMAFEAPVFSPAEITSVKSWLRLASSSQSGGEWTPSIVDINNPGNPLTQTDPDRRAAVGTTSNGLPTMVFDGTDVHVWPVIAANYATTKIGYWLWFKPATVSGVQRLLNIPANGASIQFYASGSQLQCEVYIGAGGRFGVTAAATLAAGAWHSIYLQYDSSRGGDANLAIFVNGASKSLTYGNLGAGGTLGVLSAVSGNIIVGAFNDSDTPTQGIADGGELGPNLYAFNDNLSATDIAQLNAYEVPLFSPTQLTAISAWLRLAGGTITGNGYSSVPDTLFANPAVQTNNAQRPVNGTSVNSLPIANFVTANATCLVWATATNTNQALTTKAGFAGWFKFTTYTGIFKCIFEIGGSTGAYDNSKFEVYIDSSRRVNVYHFGTDTVGYNGRTAVSPFNSVPAANNWFFLRWQFNGGSGTEALRCRTFINEVEVTNTFANVGSGGAPLTLRTTGPNIPSVFGSFGTNDNTYAIAGASGPNIYLIKDDLSVAQAASLMAYERPT